jgi:hypothetical protein
MKQSTIKTFFFVVVFISLPLLILAGGSNTSAPSEKEFGEHLAKAGFIVRLSNLIEWPDHSTVSDKKAPFVIGVIGDKAMISALREYTRNQEIRGKKVKIIFISELEEELHQLKNFNVLFIPEFSRRKLKGIIETVGKYPILTIGDTEGYEKRGVMINLTQKRSNKLGFNVNCLAAEKNGISLTYRVVRYASSIIK